MSKTRYVCRCAPNGQTNPIPVMRTEYLGLPFTGLVTYAPQQSTSSPVLRLRASRNATYAIAARLVVSWTATKPSQTAAPPLPATSAPLVVSVTSTETPTSSFSLAGLKYDPVPASWTIWYSSSGNSITDGATQTRSSAATTSRNAPRIVRMNPLTLRIGASSAPPSGGPSLLYRYNPGMLGPMRATVYR